MQTTSPTPKRRGRPAGSTSFVNVTMEELQKRFGSAQAIPVSRIWLRKLGIEVDSQPAKVIHTEAKPTSDTKIEMTLQS